MDELEISGKRYISTRLAGKEHKYHADYIGQLIRGGKVAGQKVGRSWYVDAKSLAAYLEGESTPRPPIVETEESVKEEEPVEVMQEEVLENSEIPQELIEEKPEPEVIEEKIPVRRSHLMPRPLIFETKKTSIAKDETEEKVVAPKEEKIGTEEITRELHHVPITIVASPRLRYIEEKKPLFPVMQRKATHKIETQNEQEIIVEEEVVIRQDPMPRQTRRTQTLRMGLTFVIAGCITLGVVAAVSAYVVSVTTVKGETASTGYALKTYSASF